MSSCLLLCLVLCQSGDASSLEAQARSSADRGDYTTAISRHEQALAIRQREGKPPQIAASLFELGNCYFALEQFEQAASYYRLAVAYFEQVGNDNEIATDLSAMASCYAALGRYSDAIEP